MNACGWIGRLLMGFCGSRGAAGLLIVLAMGVRMAGIAFALVVALLVALACAAPQAAVPTLAPLPDVTVPATVARAGDGAVTVVVSPTAPPTPADTVAPPTPADTVAPPTATREAPTPPPPADTVAPPESPTPSPPGAERAAPTPSPTPTHTMPPATATVPPAPTTTPAVWPDGSTPIAELGLTLSEAVAEIARRYQVSQERIGYQPYRTTVLDAEVAPALDSQDLILTVTSRLRNYRNLLDGFEIATFDDSVWIAIYEFEVHLDGYYLYEGNSAPSVTQQIRLKSQLDSDGKRIDRAIYINGQPLLDNFALNCSDYRAGSCPVGCLESCVPSYCGKDGDTYFCTSDCSGPGSCYRP